jgi:D-3-phosphoglycerate dehydrogenase / 2-oxoglutarate reductase
VQIRPDLWQQPPSRVAAAGGSGWRLAPFVRDSLAATRATLQELPLRSADGSVSADVAQADVLITGAAVLDEAAVAQLGSVRFVLRPYVGYDDIDVDALTRHGILFANVPDAFIEEVANHTLALILACNRKLLPTDAFVKSGAWSTGARNRQASVPIRRPSVLTLGLVGFGNIARLVVPRAQPFGFRILANDPYVAPDVIRSMGVEPVQLEELLAQSDIVSLHVFLNAETRHLMNAQRLALMKRDAILINTSRGPVVDEPALISALQAGTIAGAGLDVFETEPIPADSPLLGMPNVVLTSHVASYSIEGDAAHSQRTYDILSRVVNGDLPERKVVVNKGLYDALAAELSATERSPRVDRSPAPR